MTLECVETVPYRRFVLNQLHHIAERTKGEIVGIDHAPLQSIYAPVSNGWAFLRMYVSFRSYLRQLLQTRPEGFQPST